MKTKKTSHELIKSDTVEGKNPSMHVFHYYEEKIMDKKAEKWSTIYQISCDHFLTHIRV